VRSSFGRTSPERTGIGRTPTCGPAICSREENEWRWQDSDGVGRNRRDFAQPLWHGRESLAGRTIVLHAEQGLGDTLQFCRYASLVADLGARVILEAPAVLVSLLASLSGVAQIVARGDPLPAADFHCPLLTLPLAFNTTLENIPADVPYLRADPARIRHWRERLGERRQLRVGLAWSGGFRPNQPDLWSVNRRRNVPLAELAPLRHAQIEFVSLQKGEPAASELRDLLARNWRGPRLVDFTDELEDFADTAALVENLDLVISVDTSVAHLAGALGKSVWVMNRFDSCWRWLIDRSDSPWYPTLRLYRQANPGDWRAVVRNVASDLGQLAAAVEPPGDDRGATRELASLSGRPRVPTRAETTP